MSFLIALFIIAVLCVLNSAERSQKQINDKKWKESTDKWDRFVNKYSDEALEGQCRELISQSHSSVEDVVSEIKRNVGNISINDKMLLCAMMAKKCKIPQIYLWNGINDMIAWGDKKGSITREKALKMSMDRFLFLKWYNEELISNGMTDDELYYLGPTQTIGETRYPDMDKKTRVADLQYHTPGGVYFWSGVKLVNLAYGATI